MDDMPIREIWRRTLYEMLTKSDLNAEIWKKNVCDKYVHVPRIWLM